MRYMSSGSAPLSPAVHEMLKICFSCDVIQGVGGRMAASETVLTASSLV